MGRFLNPGEEEFSNIMDPYGIHDRTLRARLDTVSLDGGFTTFSMLGSPSSGRSASLPWLWVSFPEGDPGQPPSDVRSGAWGRYMPFQNDIVKVSFDYDDTPHIVGYDMLAALDRKHYGAGDGKSGYIAITKARESGVVHPNFRTLQPGEYDFMSIGGAYIYGAADGTLHLESGITYCHISNAADEIGMATTSLRIDGRTSMLRYGQVRRESLTSPGDYTALGPWNPTGSGQEFDVKLTRTVTGAEKLDVARFAIGNVANDLMVELSANSGLPKLLDLQLYNPSGLASVWSTEVDQLGSTEIASLTALSYRISVPLASFGVSAASMSLTAAANASITGASIALLAQSITIGSTPGSIVALGPNPVLGGAVGGTALSTLLSPVSGTLSAALAAAIAMSAIVAPVNGSAVGPLLTTILTYLQTLDLAIPASTSTAVSV
jgi:hypothetical protein